MPIVLWLYFLIWKNVTKMVGCRIVFKLTTKPMLTFWAGKAELIELGFRCHTLAARPLVNATKYATRIVIYNKQTRESTNF